MRYRQKLAAGHRLGKGVEHRLATGGRAKTETHPLPESNSENLDQDMDRYPRWGKVESVRLMEKTVHQTSGKAGKRETWPHGYRPFKRLENQVRVPLWVVEFEKFRAGVTAALAIGFLFGMTRTACHLFMAGRRLDKQRLGTKHATAVVLVEHDARSCHEHEGCQKDMSDPLQQILFFCKSNKKKPCMYENREVTGLLDLL